MKYLLLSIIDPVKDINDALNILRYAIKEAVYLDRTLVIGSFAIDASGNLGHRLENMNYRLFVDLAKTQICRIEDGDIVNIKESFRYQEMTDFDVQAYSDKELLLIESDKAITAEQHNRHQVIIRQITAAGWVDNYAAILVQFSASAEVERLSNIVLKTMGTNLDAVKKRVAIYNNVEFATNRFALYRHNAYYACLEVTDSNVAMTPAQVYAAAVRQIEATFYYFCVIHKTDIIDKMAFYVISANRTSELPGFLKHHNKVYRYCDFPELKALISGAKESVINNALLYSVEKNILHYATIKIVPFQPLSGLPIAYGNSSFKIPYRYRWLAWYKSLSSNSLFKT